MIDNHCMKGSTCSVHWVFALLAHIYSDILRFFTTSWYEAMHLLLCAVLFPILYFSIVKAFATFLEGLCCRRGKMLLCNIN